MAATLQAGHQFGFDPSRMYTIMEIGRWLGVGAATIHDKLHEQDIPHTHPIKKGDFRAIVLGEHIPLIGEGNE